MRKALRRVQPSVLTAGPCMTPRIHSWPARAKTKRRRARNPTGAGTTKRKGLASACNERLPERKILIRLGERFGGVLPHAVRRHLTDPPPSGTLPPGVPAAGIWVPVGVLSMIYKTGRCAEKSWRRLRGFRHLAKVIEGVRFNDGIEVIEDRRAAA